MNEDKDFSQLIDNANEDDLRDIVAGWAKTHSDFKSYVVQCFTPPIEDVDFGRKLSLAINRETMEFSARHETWITTNWRNIYYDLIKPWNEKADSMSTAKLYDLITVIITEVGMKITDEDFYGDDWYGDDFSGDIQDIMDVLANLTGLLMVRKDLRKETLDSLRELIKTAQKSDVINGYVGSPYCFMLNLIDLRDKAGEVTREIYDELIGKNFGREAGMWVCRKIDFIRSMSFNEEAQKYMENEIKYPEVCLKYYNELIAAGKWQDAIKLLDKAQVIKDDTQNYFAFHAPNWLEFKQQILVDHGTVEERIENLKHLFYSSFDDKSKYYRQLKELVDADNWETFYHNLLDEVGGFNAINEIAPFLIEEKEFDWLFRLVLKSVKEDVTDYRTPLKFANALGQTHFSEMQTIIVSSIRAYAADRFRPKKKVQSYKYAYFRADLELLPELGYADIQKELVKYLLDEYRGRPSLVKELRAIKLE